MSNVLATHTHIHTHTNTYNHTHSHTQSSPEVWSGSKDIRRDRNKFSIVGQTKQENKLEKTYRREPWNKCFAFKTEIYKEGRKGGFWL